MPGTDKQQVFMDRYGTVWDWLDDVLVKCPHCGNQARSQSQSFFNNTPLSRETDKSRRFSCLSCGSSRNWHWDTFGVVHEPVDPFTGYDLWLQSRISQGVVYVYNEYHLDVLREFVSSGVRGPIGFPGGLRNRTYFSRLPAWIKAAGNRDTIVRELDKLERTI